MFSLFLLCIVGFVILYIYDHAVPDRGWITQSAEYIRQYTGKVAEFIDDVFAV